VNDKVLVTGATGCLGSALTHTLVAAGERVAVLKRPGEGLGGLSGIAADLDVRLGDVTDQATLTAAMRGVDRVYHLAGIVIPVNAASDLMWRVNTLGSYNVARAARNTSVHRLVHVSSTASIGYPSEDVVADESFDRRDSVTTNAYSNSKFWGERLVTEAAGGGLDVVVVNPSAVFAPGGDPRYAWSRLVDVARRGLLAAMPSGGTAVCAGRDFVDGTIKAMSYGTGGRRYILSSANLTYHEIGLLLLRSVGRTGTVRQLPTRPLRALSHVVERIARLQRDPLNSPLLVPENVELMSRRLFYDQRRAVSELAMSQTPVEAIFDELVGGHLERTAS
jgi:nucleoside-diphosphate-sugar epimerase